MVSTQGVIRNVVFQGMPMGKQGRHAYPHQMQPQAIMHPHMGGAPISPTGMPGMMPGVMQQGMPQGIPQGPTSHGNIPQVAKGTKQEDSKGSSEKSSGTDSQKAGNKPRKASAPPAGGMAYPPAIPRPHSQSRSKRTGPHSQGMKLSPGSGVGADVVAHVHLDGNAVPAKAYANARVPLSGSMVRR